MKASIDASRQRAIWELSVELHQNKSKTSESIKEARAICSYVTLDTKALCSAIIKEAKTTQACTIWEAEGVCSTAIRDAETWRASQAKLLHRQHGKVMQEESSTRKADATLTSSLPARPPYMPAQLSSKVCWWLPTKFCWGRHLCLTHSPCHKGPPQWRNSLLQQLLLCQCPTSPLGPKGNILPQTLWKACLWVETHPRQPWRSPPAPNSEGSTLE